jgi:hypothetical protein
MSEKKTSHEVERIGRRAPRRDCVEAQIWGRVPKTFCTLKVPRNTVASIILKWKDFGTTMTLSRAGRPAKLMVTLTEIQSFPVEVGETSRRTTISAALHQSGLYGSGQRESTHE